MDLVKDIENLRKTVSQFRKSVMTDLGEAMVEELEPVKAESMDNTPVQFGVLKASHEIVGPEYSGSKVSAWIQVGGAAEPYAMAVHEHLSASSPPSWQAAEASGNGVHFNSGGPKFLENAVRKAIPGFGDRVMARVADRRG
jgi:hypothetical protein